MLCMLKEYSKRQETLDMSTAPSAGKSKTKRVETGVWAKEIACEASSCFHESSPLRLLFCISFFVLLCLCKRCKRLGDRSRCLALNHIFGTFELQQQHLGLCGSFPCVLKGSLLALLCSCSSRLTLVSGAQYTTFLSGGKNSCSGVRPGCQKGASRDGPVNADFD